EETNIIQPSIVQAQNLGIPIKGPFAADTIFHDYKNCQRHTRIIALYHDQGLIPIKYNNLDEGVNITLGLPFVRTSPDHGTAFDKAGLGKASPLSFQRALQLADILSA
ncbi:MAG: 4-hydroxythreonine-4-phosphate dehydrogenase PdxA, partial [Gammaproteobacteria bacterium]|nr:4-hydroxythreonine-4-phosphate dehydrogenase PdxA [Gammaproteobacteria bacterium]